MDRDQAVRFIHDLLKLLISKKGSDLFLTAEFPPAFKVDGRVTPVSNQPLTAQHTAELVRAIMNDRQAAEFESTRECNFAISPTGIGRFRVSAFVQQGNVGIVFRVIADKIPTSEELNLPPIVNDLAMAKRGIVMMVGNHGCDTSSKQIMMPPSCRYCSSFCRFCRNTFWLLSRGIHSAAKSCRLAPASSQIGRMANWDANSEFS